MRARYWTALLTVNSAGRNNGLSGLSQCLAQLVGRICRDHWLVTSRIGMLTWSLSGSLRLPWHHCILWQTQGVLFWWHGQLCLAGRKDCTSCVKMLLHWKRSSRCSQDLSRPASKVDSMFARSLPIESPTCNAEFNDNTALKHSVEESWWVSDFAVQPDAPDDHEALDQYKKLVKGEMQQCEMQWLLVTACAVGRVVSLSAPWSILPFGMLTADMLSAGKSLYKCHFNVLINTSQEQISRAKSAIHKLALWVDSLLCCLLTQPNS